MSKANEHSIPERNNMKHSINMTPKNVILFDQSISRPLGYYVEMVAIPIGLPPQDPVRTEFDDRSIDVPNTEGSLWFKVYASDTASYVGHATFACANRIVECDGIEILPGHKNKGIATAIYDLAEEHYKASVRPSINQTAEAAAFWNKRNAR